MGAMDGDLSLPLVSLEHALRLPSAELEASDGSLSSRKALSETSLVCVCDSKSDGKQLLLLRLEINESTLDPRLLILSHAWDEQSRLFLRHWHKFWCQPGGLSESA